MAGVLALAEWVATKLEFTFPDGLPAYVAPNVSTPVLVEITEVNGGAYLPGSARLLWRVGGSGEFVSEGLIPLGGDLHQASLPATDCGATVEYYFEAETTDGTVQRSPFGAPLDSHSVEVADVTVLFADDFEADLGWTVENVALTDGAWGRGIPAGDGTRGDPIVDADGSGSCFLTDNVAGNSDVDGGPTRLVSPVIDLSTGDPVVRYSYWMYNDDGDDPFAVEVSNDAGATWTFVREVIGGGGGWTEDTFRVSDFVTPTAQTRFRFSVTDNPNDSVTEAGLDAFEVLSIDCDAPVIVLDPVTLVRGLPATFTVRGAVPGTEVYFYYTKQGTGDGPCDPFFGGLCFDLLPPVKRFALVVADAQGVATRTKTVPNRAPLRMIYMQAINRLGAEGGDSVSSDVVETLVTEP
jgi:hypothetical protein